MSSLDRPLTIGYCGSLSGGPDATTEKSRWWWKYRRRSVDASTRTGLYVIEAVKQLADEDADMLQHLRIQLWGKISAAHSDLATRLQLNDVVQIDGYLPFQESADRLAKCDVLFLPLESGIDGTRPLFIPGKLYEYFALRKPILGLMGESDCRDYLQQSGLGLLCAADQPGEICACLRTLIDHRHNLNERFAPNEEFLSRFHFSRIAGQVAEVFDDVRRADGASV